MCPIFGGYEGCIYSSRELVTSLEKKTLIRLLVWSRKVYETRNKESSFLKEGL